VFIVHAAFVRIKSMMMMINRRSLRSVRLFLHSSPFYPTPKSYALQWFSISQTPLNFAPSHVGI